MSSRNGHTIIVTAGGTGGHIFPAISVAEELIKRGFRVIFSTDERGKKYLSSSSNIELITNRSGALMGGGILAKIRSLFLLGLGTIEAFRQVKSISPSLVIGFGGYASAPTLAAAFFAKIPFAIHEQNAVLGRANRLFVKKAKFLAISFPNTKYIPENILVQEVGMPVRASIFALKQKPYQPPSENEDFRLFIVGGSQGAKAFSSVIPEALIKLPEELRKKLKVVQQCRVEDLEAVKKTYEEASINAELAKFFDDMPEQIKEAHLIISRSGASSTSEIISSYRPAILIPLPTSADNHQLENAKSISEAEGGWLIQQGQDAVEKISAQIENLIKNPILLTNASQQLAKIAPKNDAAVNLADIICAQLNLSMENKNDSSTS